MPLLPSGLHTVHSEGVSIKDLTDHNTVEPLGKGHFGTSNFCPQLSLIGRFPHIRG